MCQGEKWWTQEGGKSLGNMGEEISWSSSGGQDSSKEATILPKSWGWEDRSLPVDQRVEACLEGGKIGNSLEVEKCT